MSLLIWREQWSVLRKCYPSQRTEIATSKTQPFNVLSFVLSCSGSFSRKIAESEGHVAASPKGALQKAYALQLIDDEKLWLAMMQDRNLTSHTYRELLANEIYHRVKTYFPSMKKAVDVTRAVFSSSSPRVDRPEAFPLLYLELP